MRSLLTSLVALSFLLGVAITSPLVASDRSSRPSASSIEQLLRELLAKRSGEPRSLIPYRDAELMAFGLVVLDRLSESHWYAEIDATFDFGPGPKAVLGYERVRGGRYEVFIKQHDGTWRLQRFNPKGRVQPLPAKH